MGKKPRIRFCWLCGRKLRGNHFVETVIDEHPRIMHKACAKWAEREQAKDLEKERGWI